MAGSPAGGTLLAEVKPILQGSKDRRVPCPVARPSLSSGQQIHVCLPPAGADCGDLCHLRQHLGSCRMGLIPLGEL